eukprot:TRINITY_DN1416_c0_g2_i1.p1 TRINITY_DN1416_c0_g2~~TRINITY_DN1416_c0_g2_i1.p1  ORF type:complete len:126 (+),score=17.34 TRINITY_DN1416_c0_g2_i1:393-770(+)
MGIGLNSYRHDYGTCRDDNPVDGKFHCTGADSVIEGGNMPAAMPILNCLVDSQCKPNRLNTSFAVAESVQEGCDYQAVARFTNSTNRIVDIDGRAIDGQGRPVFCLLVMLCCQPLGKSNSLWTGG